MAWDSTSARRRHKNASLGGGSRSITVHTRQPSKAHTSLTKSSYVADPFLDGFLLPSFDPVEYLNTVLPPLKAPGSTSAFTTTARGGGGGHKTAASLADVSAEAQTVVSQLNAHTSRLTSTLTQLTDDILRSGSRLAYEVELLRGKTLSLAETLVDGLHDDVDKFVPGGVRLDAAVAAAPAKHAVSIEAEGKADNKEQPPPPPALVGADADTDSAQQAASSSEQTGADATAAAAAEAAEASGDPSYITQLRTLTLVRSRLDSVIKTFGDAMEFVFPPSELSVSSSFLSVSAPEPGSDAHSTEDKGQQVLRRLRDEIAALLSPLPPTAGGPRGGKGEGEGEDDDDGDEEDESRRVAAIEAATRRIQELKDLSVVWRGTAEEKGRAKFVDSLARMVEDRHRELMRDIEAARRDGGGGGGGAGRQELRRGAAGGAVAGGGDGAAGQESKAYATAYGLISQLQKMRSGL